MSQDKKTQANCHHDHGPGCGCHHDHDHNHHDHHDHDHADPVLKDALTQSALFGSSPEKTYQVSQVQETLEGVIRDLGQELAEEGMVLGHIKAQLDLGRARIFYSMTRLDDLDTRTQGSLDKEEVQEWKILLNINSLVGKDRDLAPILAPLEDL